MENSSYDVIVVGAGIVGLSTAYHIKRQGGNLRILVMDKAPTFAQGNTGKSAAGFRDLFSSETNFKLSSSTIDFYRHVQAEMGYDLGMNFSGYLFLMSEEKAKSGIVEEFSKITRIRVLDKDELSGIPNLKLVPSKDEKDMMGLENAETGVLGLNCGIIEPDLVARFYFEECRKMGVEFSFSTKVEKILLEPVNPLNFPGEPFYWQKKKITAVDTSIGTFRADTFIIATDVWTTQLLDPLGIDSHVRPKKRQIFTLGGKEVEDMVLHSSINSDGIMPFTILPSHGVYLRPAPKERSLWIGLADDLGRDFSFTEDPQPEPDFYSYNMAQVLAAYLPVVSTSRTTSSWAGYYSYSTTDMNPYIFRELNLVVSTGTSGSGILKGDAIGRYTAAVFFGSDRVKLYGGKDISSQILGVERRNVEREKFIL
ncbi:MAG: FAD-binding oxidoreductase [Thermoplasmataceae archaeon]